jgi:hypothetical protein
LANGDMILGSYPMAWVEHLNCQAEAPKGVPDLGDWPGPWRVIREGADSGCIISV